MRARPLLLVAPLLAVLCLLLGTSRTAASEHGRTTFVGISLDEPAVDSGPTSARVEGDYLVHARWSQDEGGAVPVGAELVVRVHNGATGFDETFSVPVATPTTPGIQDLGDLATFGIDLPAVAPGAAPQEYDLDVTYTVTFGPGHGTGTSVSRSSARCLVFPPAPTDGSPALLRPIVPDGGYFIARPGEAVPLNVALANNLCDAPLSVRLDLTPSWGNGLPEGSDPDGVAFDPSVEIAQPTLTGPRSEGPLTPPTTRSYATTLAPEAVEVKRWEVHIPGDAVEGLFARVLLDMDWTEEGASAAPRTGAADVFVWIYVGSLPPLDTDRFLSVLANTGAFSRLEFTGIEIEGAGTAFAEAEGETNYPGATRQLRGIGAPGWSLDTVSDEDALDVGGVEDVDELVARLTSHLSRGTFVQTISHTETTVVLPNIPGAYRVHEVSRAPDQSSNWESTIDFVRDRIVIFQPGGNGAKRKKLLETSYSGMLLSAPEGFHVFDDSWFEFRVPGPYGSIDTIDVAGWNADLAGQGGTSTLSATARRLDGANAPILVRADGDIRLGGAGVGNGSIEVPVSLTEDAPTTPGLLTGLVEIATSGNAGTDNRTFVAGWGREMLEQHVPGLDVQSWTAVLGPLGSENDRATLITNVTPRVLPPDPAGKRRAPLSEECRDILVDVAGVVTRLTLDEKGKAKSADGTRIAKAKIKRARDGTETVQLKLKLKKLSLSGAFEDEGVVLEDIPKPGRALDIPVKVIWCGTLYAGEAHVNLRGKHARSAKLKLVK